MTMTLEHLLVEERLTETRLFCLEQERLRGSHQCIKIPAEDEGRLFPVAASDTTRAEMQTQQITFKFKKEIFLL